MRNGTDGLSCIPGSRAGLTAGLPEGGPVGCQGSHHLCAPHNCRASQCDNVPALCGAPSVFVTLAVCDPCLLTLEIPSNPIVFVPVRDQFQIKKKKHTHKKTLCQKLPRFEHVRITYLTDTKGSRRDRAAKEPLWFGSEPTFSQRSLLPLLLWQPQAGRSRVCTEMSVRVLKGGEGAGSSFRHIWVLGKDTRCTFRSFVCVWKKLATLGSFPLQVPSGSPSMWKAPECLETEL